MDDTQIKNIMKVYPNLIKICDDTFKLSSIPVTSSRHILNWIVETDQMLSFKKGNKSLMVSFVKEMREEFGKHKKVLNNEYKVFLWQLRYRGIKYNIYTGEGMGTSIEVIGIKYENLNKYDDEIIEFMKSLSIRLNKLNLDHYGIN